MSLFLKLLAEGVALGAPLVLVVSYLMAKLLVRESPDLRSLFYSLDIRWLWHYWTWEWDTKGRAMNCLSLGPLKIFIRKTKR